MSGSFLPLDGQLSAEIEHAPEMAVRVRFNGQQRQAVLTLGKSETINFGNFTVEIDPVEIIRKSVEVTGWAFTLKARIDDVMTDRTYICLEPEDAIKQFRAEFGNVKIQKMSKSQPPSA